MVFVALAILEKHREVIMEHLMHFDEVLKYGMFVLLPSSFSSLSKCQRSKCRPSQITRPKLEMKRPQLILIQSTNSPTPSI